MSDAISILDDEVDEPDEPDPGELTEADVGTILGCGCEVTRANFARGDLDYDDDEAPLYGHDYPDTGCGDCRFGVPAVWHVEESCSLYQAGGEPVE